MILMPKHEGQFVLTTFVILILTFLTLASNS